MIKTIAIRAQWLLFGLLLAIAINGAFGAAAPAAPAADDDTITVVIDLDQLTNYIERLEAALGHWYTEAKRLQTSKGCN